MGYTKDQWINRTAMDSVQITGISDTAVALSATSIPCKEIFLEAPATNTQNLRISGSDVDVNNGVQLQPGENFTMTINDVSYLQVIAEAAGNETLDYSYTI